MNVQGFCCVETNLPTPKYSTSVVPFVQLLDEVLYTLLLVIDYFVEVGIFWDKFHQKDLWIYEEHVHIGWLIMGW